MSRQDQINAELASRVEAGRQSLALQLKQSLSSDDRVSILTDDEAIIATGDVYARGDKRNDTVQYIVIGIVIAGVFFGFSGGSFEPFIIFCGIAFAVYYFMWIRWKKNALAKIVEEFWKVGDSKKARLKLANQGGDSPASIPTASSFDVPPQDG